MSKIKLSLDIDSEIYETLKRQLKEMTDSLGGKISVTTIEEYIESILASYVKSGEQIKKMGSKFTDLMDMFGGDINNLDIESILNGGLKKKEETKDKKEEKPDPSLKN
jgi:hypothetical protein